MSMNERERLLAILYAMPEAMKLSEMADYLLEHGITVSKTKDKKCSFCKGYHVVKKFNDNFHKNDPDCSEKYVVALQIDSFYKGEFKETTTLKRCKIKYCPLCGKSIKEGKNEK